jgi:hypothetical protein
VLLHRGGRRGIVEYGDRIGPRQVLLGSIAVFTAASALRGLAGSLNELAPQHVGGALLACELGHQFARDGIATVDDHHPGAFRGERERHAPADVGGGGGDDDDLACQSRLHGMSTLSGDPAVQLWTISV